MFSALDQSDEVSPFCLTFIVSSYIMLGSPMEDKLLHHILYTPVLSHESVVELLFHILNICFS